jgi:tetratricopeptide (TPR) repeat protein
MLATKKPAHRATRALWWFALAWWLGGCTPPGPRALLEGDRLIREGKYPQAIQRLETARQHMGQEPRVWHWLGLAYQGAGQSEQAIEAYQKALSLDRSNLVVAARFNLGCLHLERSNVVSAVDELRSFCLLSNSLPGLLKLGQAEWQARQWDAAEKTFQQALRLSSTNPAALNGLGLVQAQRGRLREAAQSFQSALRSSPTFAPALLNLAVLYHQQPGQRAYAAQKYHEFLSLDPKPAHYEAVRAISQQLDQELARPPAAPSNVVAATHPPRSNAPVILTSLPPVVAAAGVTSAAPQVAKKPVPSAATNIARPVTNLPPPLRPLVQAPLTSPPPVAVAARSNPPPSAPPTVASSPITAAPPALTVVQLPEAAPARKAQDVARPAVGAPPSSPVGGTTSGTGGVWTVTAATPKPEKKSILQKLNPFGGRSKTTSAATSAGTSPAQSPGATRPATTSEVAVVASTQALSSPPQAPAPSPSFPRYVYLSPSKPPAGDRRAAEPFFAEGLRAQQDNRPDAALKAYQAAMDKDPSYFQACYNLGLIALQAGDWKAALHAYELALAINPADSNARVQLALGLEKANHLVDAAQEMEKALQTRPDDVRLHLALANLLAQKLFQPGRARPHYAKVLELDPRHPRANEIRYWLAANP